MKTGTLDKMKFLVLKNLLGVPKFQVMGLLEGLWYLTATNAPDGAIGAFSDLEIAAWLEWPGDPKTLIDALVRTRFLDRCQTHRLVVHDWSDHAPQHVKANIAKHGKAFAEAKIEEVPKEPPMETPIGASQGTLLTPGEEAPSKPNLTKPNLTQPKSEHARAPARQENPPPETGTPAGHYAKALRPHHVEVTSTNPILLAWITDGVTIDELVEAAKLCQDRLGPDKRLAAKYLDAVVRDQRGQTPATNGKGNASSGWWKSKQGIEAKGRELGMTPRGTESYDDYAERIRAKLREKSTGVIS